MKHKNIIREVSSSRISNLDLKNRGFIIPALIFAIVAFTIVSFYVPRTSTNFEAPAPGKVAGAVTEVPAEVVVATSSPIEVSAASNHVSVPKAVKALYISSWVAGTPSLRSKIVAQIEKTEANAVVLDIKDYTGMISFTPDSTRLQEVGCIENRIRDISGFIDELHSKNIYVIGRVAVFQDPCMVKKTPEFAVKTKDGSKVWKDRNGISWMDAGSRAVWDYNIEIARASHKMGFDEINFDYIRYPTDGNMSDISFPVSGTRDKAITLEGFFKYIDQELRGGKATAATKLSATSTAYSKAADPAFDELVNSLGLNISPLDAAKADISLDGKQIEVAASEKPRIIVSADLFGMVTNNSDDLGIGQVLERAAPYLDFIGPMVYPSHYPTNFNGYANPATKPYEIVKFAMDGGVKKLKAIGLSPLKLRPWLQDFNLGATYTADMVRKQIQATYDSGLTGWMLWDASNTYTVGGSLDL